MLKRENQQQVADFLLRHADARAGELALPQFGRIAGDGRQNLPGDDGMDGFFYAVVEKAA